MPQRTRRPPPHPDPTNHVGLKEVLNEAQARGLVSGGDLRQPISHAAGFATAAADPPRLFLDLGSGGGLPGLVLAILWPDAEGVLLDGGERRADFLTWAVERLDLTERISVRRARAEAAGHDPGMREGFDVVTARSFAPPAVTAECAAPLLRPSGRLIVSEPPRDAGRSGPDRWPANGLHQLGLTLGATITEPFHYQCLIQEAPCPSRYPRRTGIPAKRPLF